MITEQLLLSCKANERSAQRQVYEHLSPRLYLVCKRYLKQDAEIEEVLADTFFTIFTKLHQLKEPGAFEGWARRIAINLCLAVLRRKTHFKVSLDELPQEPYQYDPWSSGMEEKELLQLLNYLPEGCRTVFNLYAIEGYTHKEIASMLQITEGTSKSQLSFSRMKLKALVNEFFYQKER